MTYRETEPPAGEEESKYEPLSTSLVIIPGECRKEHLASAGKKHQWAYLASAGKTYLAGAGKTYLASARRNHKWAYRAESLIRYTCQETRHHRPPLSECDQTFTGRRYRTVTKHKRLWLSDRAHPIDFNGTPAEEVVRLIGLKFHTRGRYPPHLCRQAGEQKAIQGV